MTGRGVEKQATMPPRRAALYATAVLFFTNLVGYLDRSILILVVQPVKASLHLSDGEIGLMQGAAFVVTYTIAGLFMGRLIDRATRRTVLLVCVAIWSVSAAACGLVETGWQLFVARMGVGVGEAALYPAAVSLIAGYFTAEKRGTPYGVFTMGVYAGTGISLVLVGLALPPLAAFSSRLAAGGTQIEPWRMVMFSMIVPGALCCLLLAAMHEPPRRAGPTLGQGGAGTGIRDWLERRRVLLPHHLALSSGTLGLYAMNAWMPQVLIREHAMAPREAGVLYGMTIAVVGILSALTGGMLSDRMSRRSGTAGRMAVAFWCIATGLAGFLLLSVAHEPLQLMVASVVIFSPLSASLVTGIMVMSELAPERSRGQITSIYFVFAGVIGTAGGPALVGYANDAFSRKGVPLSTVLWVTGAIACSVAFASAWLALTRIRAAQLG